MSHDQIHVDAEVTQRAADGHASAAQYLRSVPDSNEAIMTCLESLGPVYAELREAGRSKLDERKACYHAHADEHDRVAAGLQQVNTVWSNHEEDSGAAFRALRENT